MSRDPALAEDGLASRRRGRVVLGGIVGLGALIGALVDCAPGSGAPTNQDDSSRATASAAAETSMTALRATFPGVLDGQPLPAKRSAEVTLPATADGTVRLTDSVSGVSVGFRLSGATPAGPQSTAAHVTYPRGGPEGADLVHRLGGAGVEDFVAFWRAPQREALFYQLEIGTAAGLRLVAGSLEMLDGDGAPRLRVAPPYVVDRRGTRHAASLSVEGCAVDTSSAPPWGRDPVEPGADTCRLVVRWPPNLDYPLLVDPQWQATSNQLANARRRATATLLQPGDPSSLVLIAGGFSGTGSALTSTELYHPLSRSFASTGSLNAARGDHAAASLRNNSLTPAGSPVVVTGGRQTLGGSLVSTNVLEVFDPTTGQWTTDAVSALPRAGHTTTLLQDDTVLVVGGIGTNGFPRNTGAVYAYDDVLGTGTLTPVANTLSDERAFHSATLLPDATVLLAGGHNDSNVAVGTAELYDPNAPGFAPLSPAGGGQASMTVGRMRHTATLVFGDLNAFVVLLAGGTTGVSENGFIDIPDVYRGGVASSVGFDLQGSPDTMIAERSDHTATLLPTGEVLLVGGRAASGGSGVEASAELAIYDTGTQAFSFSTQGLSNTPSAREEHVAALVNAGDDVGAGRAVLIAGGANGPGAVVSTAELLIQVDGEACQLDAQCESGHCVEGVCCDTECIGDCYTCVLAGNVGTCTPVPAGTNLPPSCVQDVTVTNQCDGLGNTIPITAQDCKPGICNATNDACVRRCDTNDECYVDGYCCFEAECLAACGISGGGGSGGAGGGSGGAGGGMTGSGCCANKKGKGAPCADADECLAPAFCVDGVCCESECDGSCEACEATSGACLTLGTADAPVSPNPADACPGDGACTGVCNGSSADMCFFPDESQLAEPATCVCDEGFTECHLERRECDGNGAANEAPLDCQGYRCQDGSVCRTSCTSDDDCILDFICEEGSCVELTGPSCDGNFTVRVPDAEDIDCRPFACRDTACLETCESVDDCVPICDNPDDPSDCVEYVCNAAGECVQPIVGPEVEDCSCRVVGGETRDRAPWWLGLGLLALGRRRRRP